MTTIKWIVNSEKEHLKSILCHKISYFVHFIFIVIEQLWIIIPGLGPEAFFQSISEFKGWIFVISWRHRLKLRLVFNYLVNQAIGLRGKSTNSSSVIAVSNSQFSVDFELLSSLDTSIVLLVFSTIAKFEIDFDMPLFCSLDVYRQ